MMKSSVFILGLFLFSFLACTERPRDDFDNLSTIEKQKLHDELIDTLRNEGYKFLKEREANYNPGVIYCGFDYYFEIRQNKNGQVMINNEVIQNSLHSKIVKNFTANRLKNLDNPFPPYERIDEKEQLKRIKEIEKEIENLKQQNAEKELLDYKKTQIQEYKSNLTSLNILNTKAFFKISSLAQIRMEYPKGSAIPDSVLNSYYELRNFISKQYFLKSYLEVYYDSKKNLDSISRSKMNALKWAFPIQIVDLYYMKKNNLKNHFIPVPPIEVPPPPKN